MVNKNDILEAEIVSYGSEGEGVARIDGYTLFVPETVVGDLVKLKVIKVGKNFGYGKVEEIIKPSKNRVEPKCAASKKCGGCNIMHLSYEEQLRFKHQKVVDALERIGGFKGISVANVEPMENLFNYRNKIQIPVSEQNGEIIAGFYAPRSHRTIEGFDCILQHRGNEEYLKAVLSWMKQYNVPAYNEQTHKGIVRHIYTRIGFKTGEVMVSIVANTKFLPDVDKLCAILQKVKVEGLVLKSVIHNINKEKTNVVLGNKNRLLYGEDFIFDEIDNLRFKISHNSFYQVNPVMTEKLYKKAVELLGDISEKRVFDVYCGIGTISLFLARKAKEVIGNESVGDAIRDAKFNAKLNDLENATFYVGDANEVIPSLYKEGITADAVVVDPPRKGLGEELLKTLINMTPKQIVYVSCNVATLARDLKVLSEAGYKPDTVYPFDQFPNTAHVETVVLMSRVEK